MELTYCTTICCYNLIITLEFVAYTYSCTNRSKLLHVIAFSSCLPLCLCLHLPLVVVRRLTPISGGCSGSRGDAEIHRSSSRERSISRMIVRGRSGSRERIDDRGRRSEERGRRADSTGPRPYISRPSPSPTGGSLIHCFHPYKGRLSLTGY